MGIPPDLTGVLLFVVLLWPGLVYSTIRARRRPERQLTPLRETVSIVGISLTALALTALVFAAIRSAWPAATPDIRQLMFNQRAYLSAHYVEVGWWSAAVVAAAVAGAACVAFAQSSQRLSRVPWLSRFVAPPADPSTMSSWWLAFSQYPPSEVEIHVGCSLDDGSYVSGRLYSFSQVAEDTADRDLLLRDPITMRPAGATAASAVDRAGLVAVSARHVVTMTVSYVARRPTAPGPTTADQAAADQAAQAAGHAVVTARSAVAQGP